MLRRPTPRHPGLVPGPWFVPGKEPSSRACPGTYSKSPRSKNNHRWMFHKIPDKCHPGLDPGSSGRRMGISPGRFRDDGWGQALRVSGTTSISIRPCSVIPDSFRDLGLPRDLFKKAVMLKQPPLDVSKIPDIAGGDSGTTVLWFFKIPNIAGAISGRRMR